MLINYKIRRARQKAYAMATGFLPNTLVLIYHRVIDLPSDRQLLCVSPANFDVQMEILSRNFHLISLNDLVNGLVSGSVKDRSCVVTFDDGYMDNYIYARPVLEKYSAPSTIYVTSKYLGARREFWWDELDRIILGNARLLDELTIKLNGKVIRWKITNQPVDDGWNVKSETASNTISVGDSLSREQLYVELCGKFQKMETGQIDDTIAQLREITRDNGTARPEHVAMDEEQVLDLHKGGLIEIGAHTQSHPNLANLAYDRQKSEIEGSKRDLENLLGSKVNNFAYPFGSLNHYSDLTARLVKNAGFQSAVSTFSSNVSRLCDPFQIPRRIIRNWDGETFERKLEQYYSSTRH